MTTDRPRVLNPRPAGRGAGLDGALKAAGFQPLAAPFIEFDMGSTPDFRNAVSDLAAGRYAWLVVSSATTVTALAAMDMFRVPEGTRVAAVGPRTAQMLRDAGTPVDIVAPRGDAASLVSVMPSQVAVPAARRSVLFPASSEAADTIPTGLREAGFVVERVHAYHPAPAAVDPSILADLRAGAFAGALLTSPMTARLVLEAGLPTSTKIVAIGRPTARACEAAGRPADAVAAAPTDADMVAALARVLE